MTPRKGFAAELARSQVRRGMMDAASRFSSNLTTTMVMMINEDE